MTSCRFPRIESHSLKSGGIAPDWGLGVESRPGDPGNPRRAGASRVVQQEAVCPIREFRRGIQCRLKPCFGLLSLRSPPCA